MLKALSLAALLALASPAFACAPLETVLTNAKEKYGEEVVWGGTLSGTDVVALLLQSPAGSWTIVEVRGATACVVGTGENGSLGPSATGRES